MASGSRATSRLSSTSSKVTGGRGGRGGPGIHVSASLARTVMERCFHRTDVVEVMESSLASRGLPMLIWLTGPAREEADSKVEPSPAMAGAPAVPRGNCTTRDTRTAGVLGSAAHLPGRRLVQAWPVTETATRCPWAGACSPSSFSANLRSQGTCASWRSGDSDGGGVPRHGRAWHVGCCTPVATRSLQRQLKLFRPEKRARGRNLCWQSDSSKYKLATPDVPLNVAKLIEKKQDCEVALGCHRPLAFTSCQSPNSFPPVPHSIPRASLTRTDDIPGL